MNPDELRALADALSSGTHYVESPELHETMMRAADYLRACADAKPLPAAPQADSDADIGDADREPMDAEAWAELHRLRAEAKGPDGYAIWKEAAVSERIRRVRAEKQLTERQPVSVPTKEQITADARALSDVAASECGIDRDAHWKVYSEHFIRDATEHFIRDATAALRAALAAKEQPK